MSEKNMAVGPFDAIQKLLSLQSFKSSTFNEKIEIYFHDYQLIPLMMQVKILIQENYIKNLPAIAKKHSGNKQKEELETLDCLCRAAESISDGDLIEQCLRGYLKFN